jgi:hypothetical protein
MNIIQATQISNQRGHSLSGIHAGSIQLRKQLITTQCIEHRYLPELTVSVNKGNSNGYIKRRSQFSVLRPALHPPQIACESHRGTRSTGRQESSPLRRRLN